MTIRDDVFVKTTSLPTTIRGFVRKNSDLTYTIVLNDKLNYEMQRKCFAHEMYHIERGDLDRECSVDEVEYEAHKKPSSMGVENGYSTRKTVDQI